MMKNRRLICLAAAVFMFFTCIAPVAGLAETAKVIFSESFDSSPTNGSAPSNISVYGGSSVGIVDVETQNKALKIGLDNASATMSFPTSVSTGTIWLGIRFRLGANIVSGSLFQIIDESGNKLNLINMKARSASLYDGKVFTDFRKQLWTNIHIKLNYDKACYSVYVDGRCVQNDWKITRAIPAASRIGFEFSNAGGSSSIEIDNLVSYTSSSVMKTYPVQRFSTEVAADSSFVAEANTSRVYLYEDFNAMGNNASWLHQTPFTHVMGVRNQKDRLYYEDGDRMYMHMERIAGRENFPHFEVTLKDFDATNYVIDMMLNIFELDGMGFELTLKKSNSTVVKLLNAGENGILKCNGNVFNHFDFNKWNRLSFVVNGVSSSYDVYVNGDMVAEGVSVTADLKDINQVGFQLVWGTGNASIGLDAITVYNGLELKPNFDISNFTESFVNSYDKVDERVNSFIGDKAVFCVSNSAFYKDGIKTKFEGKGYETFSETPMGSVSAMAAAYGVSCTYDAESKTATLGNGVTLTAGADCFVLNGKAAPLDGHIEEKDGMLFAPARTFFERVLSKTVSYDSEWLLLFITDDGSYISTEDAEMMRQVMFKMIFDRPTGEEMFEKVTQKFPNGEHPRVVFNMDDVERVKTLIKTDEYAKKLYEKTKLKADETLESDPVAFTVAEDGTVDLVRTREDTMIDLAVMYYINGDEKYAKRGVEELEEMVKMPYLGWGKALNSAAVMAAFTRGYDLFYDFLSDELRTQIEDCVISLWERDLLDGSNATGDRNYNYMHAIGNWVPVHNGPYLESSLVFADNPRMTELAKQQFEISQRSLEGCLADLAPDGACPEGSGYWVYNMLEIAPALKTLINCMDTTLGIEDHRGLENSCYFIIDLQGTAKTNTFHDSGKGIPHSSRHSLPEQQRALFFFADLYDDAALLKTWLEKTDDISNSYNGSSLMWYNPEVLKNEVGTELDHRYRGELDMVTLRSSFEDKNAIAITGHSGLNYMSHSHIDGGTYVLDAMDLNWVTDIGTESYASNYDPRLGKYYSTRPEGHNVYLINPRTGYQGQDIYGTGATIEFESSEKDAYAIVDMSKYYVEDVVTAQRGFKLANNRSYAVVRDEMTLKGNSDVISFIHTQADIEILDNSRAIFSQFGKKMLVEVTTNGSNVTLEEMAADMLPTSPVPQPDAVDHSEYRKLAIKLSAFGNLFINVKFTPLYDERITSTEPDNIELALWKTEEGENDAPRLSAVYANGRAVEGFNPKNTFVRVPVEKGVSKAPVITASCDDRYTMEIIQDTTQMVTDALIVLTEKANTKNVAYYTIRFEPEMYSLESLDDVRLASIKSIISEDTLADLTAVLTDGNFATEKYESEVGREYLVDLGSVQNIDSIVMAFAESAAAYKYIFDIEFSEDGNNFITKTGNWSLGTTGYEAIKLGENVKARYIRFIANGRNGAKISRLCELAVSVK